jgi:hypothetical protein
MRRLVLLLFAAASLPSLAQVARHSVYVEPQGGFETYIAAAIAKKQVPVDVLTDPARATFKLKAAPVEIKQESTGGKIARCLFAYCAGIEDKGSVSVQLIETSSSRVLWAYSVNKQRGGGKNQQSMAEAVAKHLKDFLATGPALVLAPAPTQVSASDPDPAPAVAPAPTVDTAAFPAPAPATPSIQQQGNVHGGSAAQTTKQPVLEEVSLANAARRTKERKACLELAKDNPSIACR